MSLYIHPKLQALTLECSLCSFTEVPDKVLKHLLIAHQYSQNDAYTEIESWQQTAFEWENGNPSLICERHGYFDPQRGCYPCDHD